MITKVRAKYIIAHENDTNVIYEDCEMIYEDNTIIEIGHNTKGKYDEFVDYGKSIISPGFIDLDALGDIDHALFYMEQEDNKKLYWCKEYFENGPKECMTQKEEAFKSLYAYIQLISHGITTAMPITCVYYKKAGETYEEIEEAVKNAAKLGLRVYLGPSYISAMHIYNEETGKQEIRYMYDEGKEGLERAKRFVKEYNGAYDGLINAAMVPERIELQTEEILKETKAYAKKENILMRLHGAQGEFEYNIIQNKYNMSPIKYMDKIGLLDKNTLIPHAIYASGYSKIDDKSDEDLKILVDREVSVIHCPLVYSRSGQALESFGRYKRFGVKMCMGTDTFPPNIFENIRVASAMSMHIDGNRKESYYKEFFEAATLGGAKALGRDDLGKLCKGAKADFIVIDLDDIGIGTIDDPLRTICMCANGNNIKYSIINGKVVLENGIISGIDYENIKKEAQKYYDKFKASFIERSAFKEKEEFFQNSYKIIKN